MLAVQLDVGDVLHYIPDVLAIQLGDSQNDRDDDEGDDSEAPGGCKHEEEHHRSLSHAPQTHIHVQAHLIRYSGCVSCQPAFTYPSLDIDANANNG